MQWHLEEISSQVSPGAHAVVILDQAGWHGSNKLLIPANITLLHLPPRAPELNPVENVWQFLRDNWLSNTIFKSYDQIVELSCQVECSPFRRTVRLLVLSSDELPRGAHSER